MSRHLEDKGWSDHLGSVVLPQRQNVIQIKSYLNSALPGLLLLLAGDLVGPSQCLESPVPFVSLQVGPHQPYCGVRGLRRQLVQIHGSDMKKPRHGALTQLSKGYETVE